MSVRGALLGKKNFEDIFVNILVVPCGGEHAEEISSLFTHMSSDLHDDFLFVSLECEVLGFISNGWNKLTDYGHCRYI